MMAKLIRNCINSLDFLGIRNPRSFLRVATFSFAGADSTYGSLGRRGSTGGVLRRPAIHNDQKGGMMYSAKFWKRAEKCLHPEAFLSPNYCQSLHCACDGSEVHCLQCGAYVSRCRCGEMAGMSGWPAKRWLAHERKRRLARLKPKHGVTRRDGSGEIVAYRGV